MKERGGYFSRLARRTGPDFGGRKDGRVSGLLGGGLGGRLDLGVNLGLLGSKHSGGRQNRLR